MLLLLAQRTEQVAPPDCLCPRGTSQVKKLSGREIQVLRFLSLGYTVREIAQVFDLSHKAVSQYRMRLLKKLSLRNNEEITRFAIQHRLWES